MAKRLPHKIICLTEESVETLYLLGMQDKISGVSIYVERPEAAKLKPKVTSFVKAKYSEILALKPDLILGYSDIQKDIAKDLIEKGLNVFIANHRTVDGILNYVYTLANLVGNASAGEELIQILEQKINVIAKKSAQLKRHPRVYFEEWDGPMISAIEWVSELIEMAGGVNIFKDRAQGVLAKERFTTHEEVIQANPDIIFACWCGKKVNLSSISKRDGYEVISAVKNQQIFELDPSIFLQPGPAPLLEGLDILYHYFFKWAETDY
ncbi:MAG: cobalamin-binding protein [Bacteriovoracaceae bacterium]|nr:cobalamin-binding protein [Bacteriovoracaceae bacterium]